MNVTVEDRCGDTEGDLTNVSNIGNNIDTMLVMLTMRFVMKQRMHFQCWGLSKGMIWIGLSLAQAQKIVP
ncbi:unnamed protein product [Staurois parvus]|uniref:Uncharacterized protein n=1 Tax=Staurois parvus TaxID=386267 RepID=A0ABN9AWV4_9NEOB|nr:unnamed protein product [Staurois parvus]